MNRFIVVLTVLTICLFAIACGVQTESARTDMEAQDKILGRAQTAEPAYQIQNFLARKAINKWARRMDTPNKLWYIYLRAESGAFIGYHICNTVPLSYGVSITNPQRVVELGNEQDVVMPATGIDGVFYTGADSGLYFCFDTETDALMLFHIGNSTMYDKPLDMDVPRLRLEVETSESVR
jgi:hypothetical protein